MLMTVEERKVYNKAYREANKAKILAEKKAYYLANKEKAMAYYLLNKEKINAQSSANYLANKEKVCAKVKAYKKENKEKVLVLNAEYRALKNNALAAMSDAEKENYANLVEIRDNATALFGYEWHIDHTIPLSKGGTNAIDNLEVVPASWNLAKNNTSSDAFWG